MRNSSHGMHTDRIRTKSLPYLHPRNRLWGHSAAVTTAVTDVAADKTGAAAGEMNFVIVGEDWITDHGVQKWQYIETAGFTPAAQNKQWLVVGVTSTILRVADPDAVGVDDPTDPAQTVQIVMRTLRATGRQLDLTKDILESEEVRPSRQVADQRHGFEQVEGSPGFELSLQSYSDMLRMGFAADDWVQPDLTGTGNLGITGATPMAGQATIDRAAGNWEDDGIRAGDIIRTTGFADAANNRDWRVVSVSAADMVVYDPDDEAVTEAAGAGPSMTYPGYRIDIGVGSRRRLLSNSGLMGLSSTGTTKGSRSMTSP